MHDLDPTLNELEDEMEYEGEDEFEDEFEDEDEDEDGEFEGELEAADSEQEYEYESEYESSQAASVLTDAEEMEFAAELLSVSSDEELEMFLGKLFKKVRRKARGLVKRGRRFLKRGVGRRLKRALRRVTKRVLPIAGGAVGGFFGGPAGAALGSRVAKGAGRALGLELEGLSPEDQEFEAAKRVVRLAADATAMAVKGSQTPASSTQIVRKAVASAARKHAPGLVRSQGTRAAKASGRWVRRGRSIVLMGI